MTFAPNRNCVPGVLALATLWLAAGCGSGRADVPPTIPVRGEVTLDGQPVEEGTITFHPVEGGNPAVSLIGEGGTFELSTYGRLDGAVIGQHKVTVEVPPRLDGSNSPPPAAVPKAYTDPQTSPLTVEVTAEGQNRFDIELEDQPER